MTEAYNGFELYVINQVSSLLEQMGEQLCRRLHRDGGTNHQDVQAVRALNEEVKELNQDLRQKENFQETILPRVANLIDTLQETTRDSSCRLRISNLRQVLQDTHQRHKRRLTLRSKTCSVTKAAQPADYVHQNKNKTRGFSS